MRTDTGSKETLGLPVSYGGSFVFQLATLPAELRRHSHMTTATTKRGSGLDNAVVRHDPKARATTITTPLLSHEAHCRALSSRILDLLKALRAQPFNEKRFHIETEWDLMDSIENILRTLKTRDGYMLETTLDDRSVERWLEATGRLVYWTHVTDSRGKPVFNSNTQQEEAT